MSYAFGKIKLFLVEKKYLLKFLCIKNRKLNKLNVKLIGSGKDIEKNLTSACTGFVEHHYITMKLTILLLLKLYSVLFYQTTSKSNKSKRWTTIKKPNQKKKYIQKSAPKNWS